MASSTLPWNIEQYCLQNGDNAVGATTALIRSRLSKESLQQRLVEIVQETNNYDNELNALYENASSFDSEQHQTRRNQLENEWDALTHESDEIESILKHKFGMKGGGRLQLNQKEIISAMEVGKHCGSRSMFEQSASCNEQKDEEVNTDIDSESDVEVMKETRAEKFERLEKNWSKSRRYLDPFKSDGLLSKLGEFCEKQKEENNKNKRRSKKRKKMKTSSPAPIIDKGKEFCFKLGTVKVHIESDHLDGMKPEDIAPFVTENVGTFLYTVCVKNTDKQTANKTNE